MALLKFKRSAVSGKAPALGDLELGELAINTFDGKVYMRKDNGTASIIEVGGGSGVLSFNSRTGAVTLSSSDVTTALGFTPANKAGDTFTGVVNINNQVYLGSDGSIELVRTAGGAYIDFKNTTGEDFDSRLQQSGSGFTMTGTVSAGADFRAPIFYDSENTAYYVDPATTSVINGLNVGNAQPIFSSGSFQYHWHQSPHIAYVKKTGGYSWYWRRNDTGTLSGANEVEDMSLTEDGNLFARSSVRAPMFYDSNDTSYYVNPNGFTRVETLGVVNERQYPGSMNSDWEGGYYHFGPGNDTPTGSYGHAHIIRLSSVWNVQMFFPTSNTNEPFWLRRLQNGTYSPWRRLLQEDEWIGGKYLNSNGSIQASIYYDANDTAAYVDPAGASWIKGGFQMNVASPSNDVFGGLEMREAGLVGASQSAATYAPGINFHWGSRAAARIYMNAAGHFVLGGQSDITNNRRSLYADEIFASNSVRGTIFYDSNNTGYYIDGNSTSNIYRLASYTAAQYNSGDWNAAFQNTPPQSYAWHGDVSSGGPSGTWWFYESMRHSNSTNYWGTQVAWGWEDNANELRQRNVSGGGYSAWVRYLNSGNYSGYCNFGGNAVYGGIYYDGNDTGYYANPNGTSRLSSIALGGAAGVYQGVFWAAGDLWVDGNGRKIAFTTDGSTDNGGNVSIFAVGNDFRVNNWSGSALNDNFYVFGASRDAACAGNITAYYSDDRLKTKTGTITDALAKVASLEGFTYVENETARAVGYANERQQVGVSAQAIKAVLPEAVHLAPFDYDVAEDGTITSKSGEDYLTVDYSRIVPLLIEAIKELNNKVETLEASIRSK